jgi:hypothetical protein
MNPQQKAESLHNKHNRVIGIGAENIYAEAKEAAISECKAMIELAERYYIIADELKLKSLPYYKNVLQYCKDVLSELEKL